MKEFFTFIAGCITVQGMALLLLAAMSALKIPVSNDAGWIGGCITAAAIATYRRK